MITISDITVNSNYITLIDSNYCEQFMMTQHQSVPGLVGEIFARHMNWSILQGKDMDKQLC